MLRSIGSVTFLALFMVGCGGGGSGGGGSLATYSIGGTVTGLTGSGLVLQTNAGDLVAVSGAAFTFTNQLGSGAAYAVAVQTQPSAPVQNCVVTNGSGTVGTANITNVAVACSIVGNYTVGGTVSGLVGSGLQLEICSGGRGHVTCHSPLQVGVNGAFTLDSVYPAGYSGGDFVLISNQPTSPSQNCVFSNNAVSIVFSIQNANDTSITVSCTEYAYVTNAADKTLSSYTVDPTTGVLQAVGTPTPTGTSPSAMVTVDYGVYGKIVFVANEGSSDISAFTSNPTTGALTAVPGSPFAAGTGPKAMALGTASQGGSNLYVANAGSDTVSAYYIDTNTPGALQPLSPATIATGKTPTSIVTNGQFFFVANNGGSNDISVFDGNGTAVPGSPFPAGGNPLSLALGAGGKFLYSANPDATHPSISGFSIDPTTGALSPLSGSPFPLPVSHYLAIEQTGIQTGSNPVSGYLYVTTDASIVGYAFDWTTGALTALPGFPVAAGANAYSVNIVGNQFLYVANDGAANISGFTLDLSTGALTPMAGSPFPAGNHPQFIATF